MAVIAQILSKFDDSGLKKAKAAFGDLKHAITGGIELESIKKVGDFLLEAAKAASVDEKSMLLLNTQLTRNAHANKAQIAQSNKFIERMSLQTGIVKNQLRPAYARFATLTHNVKDAQKLLTIAINTSAGTGMSQTRIVKALSKAYAGNTKSLQGMFPELKNSKTALHDLSVEYAGMAALKADPFMKFNNAMEILKEKLGNAILPLITDFVDKISKPGGLVDQVGKFLDDLSNPKTDAGQLFENIKTAVKDTIGGVKNFFALFGNGDAMKGFSNVVTGLIRALPALIALKGILVLAQTGAAIKNLVTAIALIKGNPTNSTGNPFGWLAAFGKSVDGKIPKLADITKTTGEGLKIGFRELFPLLGAGTGAKLGTLTPEQLKNNPGDIFGQGKTGKNSTTNNVTIHVHSADPKAVVDAVSQYVKVNGKVPNTWKVSTGGH